MIKFIKGFLNGGKTRELNEVTKELNETKIPITFDPGKNSEKIFNKKNTNPELPRSILGEIGLTYTYDPIYDVFKTHFPDNYISSLEDSINLYSSNFTKNLGIKIVKLECVLFYELTSIGLSSPYEKFYNEYDNSLGISKLRPYGDKDQIDYVVSSAIIDISYYLNGDLVSKKLNSIGFLPNFNSNFVIFNDEVNMSFKSRLSQIDEIQGKLIQIGSRPLVLKMPLSKISKTELRSSIANYIYTIENRKIINNFQMNINESSISDLFCDIIDMGYEYKININSNNRHSIVFQVPGIGEMNPTPKEGTYSTTIKINNDISEIFYLIKSIKGRLKDIYETCEIDIKIGRSDIEFEIYVNMLNTITS